MTNVYVEREKEKASEVRVSSPYSKRYTFMRDSVNPATAGQYVLGVYDVRNSAERSVVVRATDTSVFMEEVGKMIDESYNGGSFREESLGNGVVFKYTKTPRAVRVVYQSPISGRQMFVKYSASTDNAFVVTVTGPNGEPETSQIIKRDALKTFVEAAMDVLYS
jgi:hypothetical protein